MEDLHPNLLQNIKTNLPQAKELLGLVQNHWAYEDMPYRFLHHSFKVYRVQQLTEKIVEFFRQLDPKPEKSLNKDFLVVTSSGTKKIFDLSHNKIWLETTRPLLEAFFWCKFFLEMFIKYGEELEEVPDLLPSGWAALLYLYNLR